MDAPIWDVTVFTKNRERLLSRDVAARFLSAIINQARVQALLSDDHFSVDGTLIAAWASVKSFRPKDEGGLGDDDDGGSVSSHGEQKTAPSNAERDAALTMLGRMEGRHRITLGADKNYDIAAFVEALREMDVTPHVAQNNTRAVPDLIESDRPLYLIVWSHFPSQQVIPPAWKTL